MEIIFWGFSETFFLFAVLLMILRNLFEFLISLKKNNSKIEIWDSENFWLELEIVVSKKLQKNKQTNIRLHLETAALPTELYPCICVKLFSLQGFLPARSILPQTHTKSQDFLKNSVVKSAIFWAVRNCRKHIGRYSWRNQNRAGFTPQERDVLTSFSLYRDHCSYTPQELEIDLISDSFSFAAIGLSFNIITVFFLIV